MPRTNKDAFGKFLHDIGRTKLLSADEEIALARRIQAGIAAESMEPSPERDAAIADGLKAKTYLVQANLRLVVSIAKKYSHRMPLEDLVQEGTIGLHRGAEKFDHRKGYKFSTYAYWWIRQGITRAIATDSRSIRIPVHLAEKISKVNKFQRSFHNKHGRNPTAEEIQVELKLKPEEYQRMRQAAAPVLSLDAAASHLDTSDDLIDLIGAEEHTLDAIAEREQVNQIASTLTNQEVVVIACRYGLLGGEHNLREIGLELGISRERVRQIQNRALSKMRSQAKLLKLA